MSTSLLKDCGLSKSPETAISIIHRGSDHRFGIFKEMSTKDSFAVPTGLAGLAIFAVLAELAMLAKLAMLAELARNPSSQINQSREHALAILLTHHPKWLPNYGVEQALGSGFGSVLSHVSNARHGAPGILCHSKESDPYQTQFSGWNEPKTISTVDCKL